MELVILGLKHKETGKYMVYDVKNRKKPKHQLISIGETIKVNCLSPFPFENYSSISFDYQEELLEEWTPCYLKVDGEISQIEFAKMKSSGIMYHRFPNRKITFIEEFFDIFQYSLKIYKKMKEQLGTYDLTTWIIHNDTTSEAEFEAMKKILAISMTKKENKKYGLDLSLDKYLIPYLPFILEYKANGRKVTFGEYGRNTLTQEELNTIELTPQTFIMLAKEVHFYGDVSWFGHPIFDQTFYDTHLRNSEDFLSIMGDLYNKKEIEMISSKINMESFVRDLFEAKLPKFDEYIDWETPGKTFKEACNMNDYPIEEISHSPYDYYCCPDCDGYEITPDESDYWVEYKDTRIELINEVLNKNLIKFLPDKGRSIFDFVPDELWEKAERTMDNDN